MSEKNMMIRMRMIFTDDEKKRISIQQARDGGGFTTVVTADVHGMNCRQAKAFIRNVIALFRGSFKLVVIHGFHSGTALRDMIRTEAATFSRKVNADSVHGWYWNDGVTEMRVSALCG